jgi:hypothetical protein
MRSPSVIGSFLFAKRMFPMRGIQVCLVLTCLFATARTTFAQSDDARTDVGVARERLLVGPWACDNAFVGPKGELTRHVTTDVVTREGPNLFKMLTLSSIKTVAPAPGREWPDTKTREPRSKNAAGGDIAYLSFVDEKRVKVSYVIPTRDVVAPDMPASLIVDVSKSRISFSTMFPGGVEGSINCVKQ